METPQMTYVPLPPAMQMLGRALSFYREHWKTIIGIAILPLIFEVFTVVMKDNLTAGLATILAAIVGYFAQLAFFDAVVENGEPEGGVVGAYQKGIRLLIPFFWVGLLVSFAVMGGFILLIIPGIIFSIWLSLSLYALWVEGKRGLSALTMSWHYVRGYWGAVLWRSLVFSFFVLLLFLVVGFVGGFSTGVLGGAVPSEPNPIWALIIKIIQIGVAAPLSIIYGYILYQALKTARAEILSEEEEKKSRRTLTLLTVIGIVGFILLFVFVGFLLKLAGPEFLKNLEPSSRILPSSLFVSAAFSPLLGAIFGR